MVKKKSSAAMIIFIIVGIAIIAVSVIFGGMYFYHARGVSFERKWKIDLPNNMKLDFNLKEVYIDGNVNYSVFTCRKSPDKLFEETPSKEVHDFEAKVDNAVGGIESKIPQKYRPDFSLRYENIYMSASQGIRNAYLYIIFYPDTMRLIVCQDISQYPY